MYMSYDIQCWCVVCVIDMYICMVCVHRTNIPTSATPLRTPHHHIKPPPTPLHPPHPPHPTTSHHTPTTPTTVLTYRGYRQPTWQKWFLNSWRNPWIPEWVIFPVAMLYLLHRHPCLCSRKEICDCWCRISVTIWSLSWLNIFTSLRFVKYGVSCFRQTAILL